ncbi:hypothetical protein L3Y34_010819 [Caenorhabditis briggsae]|uniref:Uncharacterized protein n=1 Tax=Caenorhabditis briggsae TaxID=6238 RepID=A0AAE8ZR70_CAEBR|nr:hypothetical protein L3Y34_010819 [Caenorhabditis briggsae]
MVTLPFIVFRVAIDSRSIEMALLGVATLSVSIFVACYTRNQEDRRVRVNIQLISAGVGRELHFVSSQALAVARHAHDHITLKSNFDELTQGWYHLTVVECLNAIDSMQVIDFWDLYKLMCPLRMGSSFDPRKCDRHICLIHICGQKRGIQEAITSKFACAERDANPEVYDLHGINCVEAFNNSHPTSLTLYGRNHDLPGVNCVEAFNNCRITPKPSICVVTKEWFPNSRIGRIANVVAPSRMTPLSTSRRPSHRKPAKYKYLEIRDFS